MIHGNLGLLARESGDYSEAVARIDQALTIYRRLADRDGQARMHNALGRTFGMMSQFPDARFACQTALDMFQYHEDRLGMASAWYNLAFIAESEGRLADAVSFLRFVVEVDEQYRLPKLAENQERLARLEARLG